MSLSLALQMDTGGPEPADVYGCDDWNYTHNVNPMWRQLFGMTLGDLLAGKRAGDTLLALQVGAAVMERDIERYRAMNPPNGWGDADTALVSLQRLVLWCEQHPNAKWWVWQ